MKAKLKNQANPPDFKQLLQDFVQSKNPKRPSKPTYNSASFSAVLQEHRNQQSQQKVLLVQKGILRLDQLPPQLSPAFSQITKLYLSNNLISSLEHITQFPQLQVLSLANNQIKCLPTLRYLVVLKNLTNLAFQGNPIQKQICYFPYVCGVTNGRLKMLDHEQLSPSAIAEGTQHWDIYEDNMRELLMNYYKLMHLLKLYRWQSLHQTIREAGDRLYQKEHSQTNIEGYLSGVEEGTEHLAISFLTSIETMIWRDLEVLCDCNQKGYEGVITVMYRLTSKQQDKIDELTEQIKHPNINWGNQEEEISDIVSIMSGAVYGRSKQRLYAEWKLLSKCFRKLNRNRQAKNNKRQAISILTSTINFRLAKKASIFMHALRVRSRDKVMMRVLEICNSQQHKIMKSAFEEIRQQEIVHSIQQFENRRANRAMKRKVFEEWKKMSLISGLMEANQQMEEQLRQSREREQKYLNKITLLQQLLKIMENNKKQSTSPLSLIECKSYSSSAFGSPESKGIRKNTGKENLGHGQNGFVQRKLNSSRKAVRVENEKLF